MNMNRILLGYLIVLFVAVLDLGCGTHGGKANWKRYEGIAVSAEFPAEPEVTGKSTGMTRGDGSYEEQAKQLYEQPNKKVSRFNENDRLKSKDYWKTSLKYGKIEIHVKETGAGGYSEDEYKVELETVTKLLKEELGDKVTFDTIDLDGAQATSFEYPIEKDGVKRFVTRVEACHKGYHLQLNIAGYDESERESIRNHMVDSIKWDGTGISKVD